jgi:TnpA family transposase
VPRRSTLTLAERESLFAVPTDEAELIRRYAFSEQELSVIQQHRGDHNRLGFAVQLCYMRYPGYILPPTDDPAPTLLKFAANQTGINAGEWDNYARREQTRREYLVELQTSFGFQPFTVSHYRHAVRGLDEVASQTDKGIVLAQTLVEDLRRKKVLFPSVKVIERACAEAVTRATRRIYRILTESLTSEHRAQLDSLLEQFNGSKMTTVMWLRQSPGVPNAKHLLEHIQRLEAIQLLSLPAAHSDFSRCDQPWTCEDGRILPRNNLRPTFVAAGLAHSRGTYVPNSPKSYPALSGLIGGALNQKLIRSHWEQTLRVATSIKQGTVTASLMLRKLGAYPRQNGLAIALRELGRIERALFTLDWLQSVEFRRRVQVGLNKGEAKNGLARAVFFNRLGEIRDRSFENQRYRASGLNLVVAAIVLWNTTYLERAVQSLKAHGHSIHESLLQHLSPMGWEHINLTGDYVWPASKRLQKAKFRPLRSYPMA